MSHTGDQGAADANVSPARGQRTRTGGDKDQTLTSYVRTRMWSFKPVQRSDLSGHQTPDPEAGGALTESEVHSFRRQTLRSLTRKKRRPPLGGCGTEIYFTKRVP